jgi:RNA polymerase sigma-70 factor (ECF subfamily)
VSGRRTRNEGRTDAKPQTLGDVLHAYKPSAVPEERWVTLVSSIAEGDQAALNALYERMHRLVFTLSMRITQSREIAEEVTLDVFYDVWRRAPSYDPAAGTVVGWVMNQARSRAIDRLRFEQRKKRAHSQSQGTGTPQSQSTGTEGAFIQTQQDHRSPRASRCSAQERPTPAAGAVENARHGPSADSAAAGEAGIDPQESFAVAERASRLRAALTVLSADEKLAIETAFFSGLTHAETAARLDEPLGTIKTRIRSGLKKLREALAAQGSDT